MRAIRRMAGCTRRKPCMPPCKTAKAYTNAAELHVTTAPSGGSSPPKPGPVLDRAYLLGFRVLGSGFRVIIEQQHQVQRTQLQANSPCRTTSGCTCAGYLPSPSVDIEHPEAQAVDRETNRHTVPEQLPEPCQEGMEGNNLQFPAVEGLRLAKSLRETGLATHFNSCANVRL